METINPNYYKSCCKVAINAGAKMCPVCRNTLPYRSKAKDLRLGDEVRALDGGRYVTATVLNITDQGVKVLRPYVSTSDFITTGGLIGYLGYEEFTISLDYDVIVVRESDNPEVLAQETDEGRRLRART